MILNKFKFDLCYDVKVWTVSFRYICIYLFEYIMSRYDLLCDEFRVVNSKMNCFVE